MMIGIDRAGYACALGAELVDERGRVADAGYHPHIASRDGRHRALIFAAHADQSRGGKVHGHPGHGRRDVGDGAMHFGDAGFVSHLTRDDHQAGTADGIERLAPRSHRQQLSSRAPLVGADQHDVHHSPRSPMLKGVVENHHVRPELPGATDAFGAIRAGNHRNACRGSAVGARAARRCHSRGAPPPGARLGPTAPRRARRRWESFPSRQR